MRRLLALLLVLGAAAAAVWWFWIRPSTLLTCNRVAELCGTQVGDCRERLDDAQKAVGGDFSSRLARCVAGAKTCGEAVGCAPGPRSSSGPERTRSMGSSARSRSRLIPACSPPTSRPRSPAIFLPIF